MVACVEDRTVGLTFVESLVDHANPAVRDHRSIAIALAARQRVRFHVLRRRYMMCRYKNIPCRRGAPATGPTGAHRPYTSTSLRSAGRDDRLASSREAR